MQLLMRHLLPVGPFNHPSFLVPHPYRTEIDMSVLQILGRFTFFILALELQRAVELHVLFLICATILDRLQHFCLGSLLLVLGHAFLPGVKLVHTS